MWQQRLHWITSITPFIITRVSVSTVLRERVNREEPRGDCRAITVIGSFQVRDVDEIAPMGVDLALTWL